jgi:hypothetical protein
VNTRLKELASLGMRPIAPMVGATVFPAAPLMLLLHRGM